MCIQSIFVTLALAASVSAQFGGGGGFGGGGNGQNGAGFDFDDVMAKRRAHGILASLAFVGLFPLGSILMRVVPGRFAWIIHGLSQVVALIVYIVGAIVGITLVREIRIPPNGASLLDSASTKKHPIIGLVVLGMVCIQPILGFIHHVKFKRLLRRTLWSHAHLWLGRGAITLGIVNGGLGLQLTRAPQSSITAYAAVAAVMWALWLLAAIAAEVRRCRAGRKAAIARPARYGDDVVSPPPVPPYHQGDYVYELDEPDARRGHRASAHHPHGAAFERLPVARKDHD